MMEIVLDGLTLKCTPQGAFDFMKKAEADQAHELRATTGKERKVGDVAFIREGYGETMTLNGFTDKDPVVVLDIEINCDDIRVYTVRNIANNKHRNTVGYATGNALTFIND